MKRRACTDDDEENPKRGRARDPVCECCRKRPSAVEWAEYSGKQPAEHRPVGDKCLGCHVRWSKAFLYLSWREYCDLAKTEAPSEVCRHNREVGSCGKDVGLLMNSLSLAFRRDIIEGQGMLVVMLVPPAWQRADEESHRLHGGSESRPFHATSVEHSQNLVTEVVQSFLIMNAGEFQRCYKRTRVHRGSHSSVATARKRR